MTSFLSAGPFGIDPQILFFSVGIFFALAMAATLIVSLLRKEAELKSRAQAREDAARAD
ncbi:MAG: hypothetical protein R3F20_03145 [Planctomycetota bacterium]